MPTSSAIRLIVAGAVIVFLGGCDAWPRDTFGTTNKILSEGVLHAGLSPNPPWTSEISVRERLPMMKGTLRKMLAQVTRRQNPSLTLRFGLSQKPTKGSGMKQYRGPVIGSHANTILWWQMVMRGVLIFLYGVLLVRLAPVRIFGPMGAFDIILWPLAARGADLPIPLRRRPVT